MGPANPTAPGRPGPGPASDGSGSGSAASALVALGAASALAAAAAAAAVSAGGGAAVHAFAPSAGGGRSRLRLRRFEDGAALPGAFPPYRDRGRDRSALFGIGGYDPNEIAPPAGFRNATDARGPAPNGDGGAEASPADEGFVTERSFQEWTNLMADGTNGAAAKAWKVREERAREESEDKAMADLYTDLGDLSRFDTQQIETYWEEIMPTVTHLGSHGSHRVKQALVVAYRAHRDQRRKSGEPFVIHPVQVALLLAGLQMDAETVIAGLLHDTVEDTDLTFSQVDAMFGSVVRNIVEGETKVSKLPQLVFNDYADEQAENLRQMFVAMTDDYRIIIVKLADRLHNMRTLQHMKPEKQEKISRETLEIFAPLAHRMGIWQFKSELEDTAFMYLYPSEYRRLNRELRRHQTKFRETLDKSKRMLQGTLEADPTLAGQSASIEVYGRTKELYSLWHKMETKADHDLDHIADVVALRVILTPKEDGREERENTENMADRGVWLCYHVLGLVQHLPGFQPVPTRVKDYISFPKPNGYQSLHTALMLNGQNIEVQIRTAAMHHVAEYGMASHWAYKDGQKMQNGNLYKTPWLSSIKEWQDDVVSSRDFVDCVRRELLGKRVFVFLRNGKILNLARGATAIDAAFQIHTEVGIGMHGAEINGKPVPFSYELQNGDVISVLTGKGTPETDWMRYAKSRSTRSKLRVYFRAKQKESLREAGKILLLDFLSMHKDLIESSSFLREEFEVPVRELDSLSSILPGKTRYSDLDQLLIAIGKSNSRGFLRGVISKLYKVPVSKFVEAEESYVGNVKEIVTSALLRTRNEARQAAEAAEIAGRAATNGEDINGDGLNGDGNISNGDDLATPQTDENVTGMSSIEIADPDHLCEVCLPVYGDEIIGTLSMDEEASAIPTVHRRGCPHAERAIMSSRASSTSPVEMEPKNRDEQSRFTRQNGNQIEPEVTVELKWSEAEVIDECDSSYYLAEIVVVAADRKLLLADCSEAVSRSSEIVRTGTLTTNEHAKLEFLVQVRSVDELQLLMDELNEIDSVMSVERRFGSELQR